MKSLRAALVLWLVAGFGGPAAAQTPPKEPPPLWETQVGGSFVGTSGNTETTTLGADFGLHRRWPVWQIESTATAVRVTDRDVRTAERYLAAFRGQRKLSALLSLSAGERAERDRLSGIEFRSILDGGLGWALVRMPRWTLDGITGIAWSHERSTIGPDRDHPVGILQALSRIPFGAAGDTTQRITVYPDFKESSAYRSEGELTAQAAMNSHLALKLGYIVRRSNTPVPGFRKTDTMTTASVVLRWKSTAPAP
jgi:putative salt-induced outer membrane protein